MYDMKRNFEVTVTGQELVDTFTARAIFHKERAATHKANLDKITAIIPPKEEETGLDFAALYANSSSGKSNLIGAADAARAKVQEHIQLADKFAFFAAHTRTEIIFYLTLNDLNDLKLLEPLH